MIINCLNKILNIKYSANIILEKDLIYYNIIYKNYNINESIFKKIYNEKIFNNIENYIRISPLTLNYINNDKLNFLVEQNYI